ncbi:keratin, type I cytoskeletal 20 [Gracilinanus agilis]|uniref:keratin, type I cytoskeletal 20 n=1 Tax=Gracilinanus agilis TaxID=191870 RepID=UPI001CFEEED4|nr:keratin, type I cytoskeletal 20 [Gracilinanus agilis]
MDFSPRSFHRSSSSSSGQPGLNMNVVALNKRAVANFYAPSVYGGAGGQGTRISQTKFQANYGGRFGGSTFSGDEKLAMQNLNDRLANYLEKVRSLEQSNANLDLKIRQWYEKNSSFISPDHSAYYKTIEDLRNQIKAAQLANARCLLQLDNYKLTSEDFRLKYEAEYGMRMSVEADLQGLKKVFDDFTLRKTDLEIQIENVNEDLAFLKKNHQEEIAVLHKQLGKTVNVEVDASPGQDLAAIMNEMREKYKIMAEKHLQEAKEQFEKQINILQEEVTVSTTEIKANEAQVTELRRKHQSLEIELQSLYSMKQSFERALEETNTRYGLLLKQNQELIRSLEAQLMQVRTETERQNEEYKILFDIKTHLEMEIATYRRLLEGEDIRTTELPMMCVSERNVDMRKTRKIKTLVEEMVDGKVVSSEIKEIEEEI